MKSVQFKCPYCGQTYECSASDVGADAECGECGNSFRIKPDAVSFVENRPTGFGCYIGVFKRYFDFRGRLARREFWWAVLFNAIIYFIAGFVDALAFGESDDSTHIVTSLISRVTIVPMIAAQVRRLHDTDKSGWLVCLSPLPVLNIAYLVWLSHKGDQGVNRFGEPTN